MFDLHSIKAKPRSRPRPGETKTTGGSVRHARGEVDQLEIEEEKRQAGALTEQTVFCCRLLACERTSFATKFDGQAIVVPL
jgi:hypothetical protein